MNKWFTEILYTEEQLNKKIKELANWVNKAYAGTKNLVLVGLLKGSIPFLAQLMKSITIDHTIDFMTVSSFEGKMESTGNVKVILDLKQDIFGKDVLIVEDIVDSGRTLSKICEHLKDRNPNSLKVITLLDKPKGRKVKFEVDRFGFEIPNVFIAGFGLDVKEKLRNLPYIGIFDKSKLDKL